MKDYNAASVIFGVTLTLSILLAIALTSGLTKKHIYNQCEKHGIAFIHGEKLVCEVTK